MTILTPKDSAGNSWNEAALLSLAPALQIAHKADGTIEVTPDIDLGKYAAAATALAQSTLIACARTKQSSILALGATLNVAASGAAALYLRVTGSAADTAELGALWRFGAMNAGVAGTSTHWVDDAGIATVLTAAQCIQLDTLASAWRASVSACFAAAVAAIKSGTVTTAAAIDALAWPTGA